MKKILLFLLVMVSLNSSGQDTLSGCWSLSQIDSVYTSYDDAPGKELKVFPRIQKPKVILKTGTIYKQVKVDSLVPIGSMQILDSATVKYISRSQVESRNNHTYKLDSISADYIKFTKIITSRQKGYQPPRDAPHPRGKGSPGFIQKEYITVVLRRFKQD